MSRLLNRYLKLVFTRGEGDQKHSLTLTSNEIYFTIKISKYQSNLKDEMIVEIFNLSQEYIEKLKLYDTLTVYAGRYNEESQWIQCLLGTQTILSITNDKSDLSSLKTIIVCSSRFRKRDLKPITISSGKTLWSTLQFICKRGTIRANISPQLKNRVLQKPLSVSNINSSISQLMRDYPFIKINNDSKGEDFDVHFDYIDNRKDRVSIIISPENRTLVKDWVQVEGNGDVSFTALPNRVSFKIGDNISINSKYFNTYIDSSSNYTNSIKITKRLEKTIQKENDDQTISFEYIIISLDYQLDVKGTWELKIKARPRTSFTQRTIRGGF